MVSKDADRTRRYRAVKSPQSDSTRRMAVSVKCPCQNPDCRSRMRSADDRYSISWQTRRHSKSFDKTDRFDIGRYKLAVAALSPDFFITAVINNSLNTAGNWPVDSEQLNSSVINGAKRSAICFNTDVGTRSAVRQSPNSADDVVRCQRLKLLKGDTGNIRASTSAVLDLTLATFSAKNRLKTSTSVAELACMAMWVVTRLLASKLPEFVRVWLVGFEFAGKY